MKNLTEQKMATFRETLRTLLFQKDIKLIDLARRARISYAAVRGYTAKNASRRPSVSHLIAIAKVLDVSLDVFRDCQDFQIEGDESEGSVEDSEKS